MKTFNFKYLLVLPLFMMLFFASCQEEAIEVTNPTTEEALVADSNLATLMRLTSTNDGSDDDMMDSASCLEIQLPVTVIVNGVTITINSPEDQELIIEILEESDSDEDTIELVFPITIIHSDYTSVVVESQEDFEVLLEECDGENEEDEDIECIDFQYPFSVSIYNSDDEVIDTIEIGNDEELYNFCVNLDDDVFASLNFPITLILSDGSTTVVNSNAELETAIGDAINTCDENDDNDWDDDEYEPIGCLDVIDLVICDVDDVGFGTFNLYEGLFEVADCDVAGFINVSFHTESWDAEDGVNPIVGATAYTTSSDFETVYVRIESDEDPSNYDILSMDLVMADCSGNCDIAYSYLIQCSWNIVSYNGDDFLAEYDIEFGPDLTMIVSNSSMSAVSYWDISAGLDLTDVVIGNIDLPNIEVIEGPWLILGCSEERLIFQKYNDDNTSLDDIIMVMERDCS